MRDGRWGVKVAAGMVRIGIGDAAAGCVSRLNIDEGCISSGLQRFGGRRVETIPIENCEVDLRVWEG